jgi:hypothetical protein
MQNDDIQEDVTLENNVEQEVEETEDFSEETPEESTEETTDWKAEAKKWEAIARRKAKKAEAVESAPQVAPAIDAELAETVYRNHLASHGLTTQEAQDKAFELAKKTGVSVTKLTQDADILEVLRAKDKAARTKQAVSSSTGGTTVTRTNTARVAGAISQGKSIKESDLSGAQALEILGLKR